MTTGARGTRRSPRVDGGLDLDLDRGVTKRWVETQKFKAYVLFCSFPPGRVSFGTVFLTSDPLLIGFFVLFAAGYVPDADGHRTEGETLA